MFTEKLSTKKVYGSTSMTSLLGEMRYLRKSTIHSQYYGMFVEELDLKN